MNIARQLAREKIAQKHEPANRRVKVVIEAEWQKAREEKFATAIKFAACIKANRTALYITQEEAGAHLGITGQRFGQMESGHYFGWNVKKLNHVLGILFRIARERK